MIESIGIIGGADGPTSILIAGNKALLFDLFLVVLLICVIVFIIKKWRKK